MLNQQEIQAALDRCFGLMTDPKKLYIIQPYNIGDMMMNGMLAYAALKKFNLDSAILIVQERFRNLDISFTDVSDMLYLSFNDLLIVREFLTATGRYEGKNYFYGHVRRDSAGNNILDPRLNFNESYKHNIFNVPLDTPLQYPIVKDISEEAKQRLARAYDLDRQRTIILMPYTNSIPLMQYNFWQKCVQSLLQRGYQLYTNVGRRPNGSFEQPLLGTLPINVGFNEIFYIAGQVKCLVGYRSGLFDFLVFSKGNLICLAPQWQLHSDLKLNFPQTPSQVRSLYFDWQFIPAMKNLMDKFNIASINEMHIQHKYIPVENFFCDENNMLAAVLRAVEAQ